MITWGITFLGTWGFCIVNYGFLLGVGLGWHPAMIVAYVAGFLWPLLALILLGLAALPP